MIRGALIGFGNIAQKSHLPAFEDPQIKPVAKLTAVVEPNENNRTASRHLFPELNFYQSFDELIKNEPVDFVDITTPPKFHKEVIEEAVKNNLNIISEKPFTFTLEEAEQLHSRLNTYPKIFIPCHQYRYSKLWKNFKQAVDSISIDSKILLKFSVIRKNADPGLRIFNNPWRTDKETSGGGILTDTGVHYLYLSNWLLGKPLSVFCRTSNITHNDYVVEDTAVAVIEFERGIAEITLTWGGNRRFNSADLISKELSLNYSGGKKLIEVKGAGENVIDIPDISDKSHYTSLYVSLFSDFVNMIKSGRSSNLLLDEALISIELLDACYRSAAIGKSIKFEHSLSVSD